MCSHYQAVQDPERYSRHFAVVPPAEMGKLDVWPGYGASFIRRHPHADAGDDAVPEREALTGLFGLVPHWANDTRTTRHTFNARSETVAEKPSFRDAWKRAQRCIIPAEAFFEPDWRSGKAVSSRIAKVDGEPIGIAGLWSAWKSAKGDVIHSFTMLTVNADEHPLMRDFHKPTDEKRMVVVLAPERYGDWLAAAPDRVHEFMKVCEADTLWAATEPAPQAVLGELARVGAK